MIRKINKLLHFKEKYQVAEIVIGRFLPSGDKIRSQEWGGGYSNSEAIYAVSLYFTACYLLTLRDAVSEIM